MNRKKIEIIPAILPMTFSEIEDRVSFVVGKVKSVQVDICDGKFVPNATWPCRKPDDTFNKIIKEEEGMPKWKELNYEFDLMVNDPETMVEYWVSAGASRIVIHIEAKSDVSKAIDLLQGKVEIGLALAVDTSLKSIELFRDRIQFIQLMGIDNVGFQHQSFDDKVLGRIREARTMYPEFPISVDGAVSLETAPLLIDSGVDRLVIGSAIWNTDNPVAAVDKFKKLQ